MYQRNTQEWMKHLDFLVIDQISLQLSLIVAIFIRLQRWAYAIPRYRGMGLTLFFVDALVLILHNSMHHVLTRGNYEEGTETVKHSFIVFALATIFMFASQTGKQYSRIILFLTFIFYILLGFCTRTGWKQVVKRSKHRKERPNSLLLVTSRESAPGILNSLRCSEFAPYKVIGVVLTEKTEETSILGYPVVADLENAADYIVREWIDGVYINASMRDDRVARLMETCSLMAVPTHYYLSAPGRSDAKRFTETINGTIVLTTTINAATPVEAFLKRVFDILAGLIGSAVALLIMAVVGPIIKLESPGPILFTQERVGKNGKRFKMYKIRSMYLDAEERKKELLNQNRVKDGRMFKLDFDPRIIGNRILPDGTKKTGIGEWIRRCSLDEWPQFFNVLEGSMSCVGTRPPTVDEWEKYEYHHRARLAIKPGITGLWQVSGRSEITDFEEVVRMDTEYITNWSPEMDLKILAKTIKVLVTGKGAM